MTVLDTWVSETIERDWESLKRMDMARFGRERSPWITTHRFAKAEEKYMDWLAAWVYFGHRPSHYYDYSIKQMRVHRHYGDYHLVHLCGSQAYQIILGYNSFIYPGGSRGHCNIYGYGEEGPWCAGRWIPVYGDSVHTINAKMRKL